MLFYIYNYKLSSRLYKYYDQLPLHAKTYSIPSRLDLKIVCEGRRRLSRLPWQRVAIFARASFDYLKAYIGIRSITYQPMRTMFYWQIWNGSKWRVSGYFFVWGDCGLSVFVDVWYRFNDFIKRVSQVYAGHFLFYFWQSFGVCFWARSWSDHNIVICINVAFFLQKIIMGILWESYCDLYCLCKYLLDSQIFIWLNFVLFDLILWKG